MLYQKSTIKYLNIQLGTYSSDPSVLEILNILADIAPSKKDFRITSSISTKNRIDHIKCGSEFKKFITNIKKKKFNKLCIKFLIFPQNFNSENLEIFGEVNGQFYLSPLCSLWYGLKNEVKKTTCYSYKQRSIIRNYRGLEIGLKANGIIRYPTILNLQLKIKCHEMVEDYKLAIVEMCLDLFRRSAINNDYFAYIDILENPYKPNVIAELSQNHEKALQFLDTKLDRIHHIVIGNKYQFKSLLNNDDSNILSYSITGNIKTRNYEMYHINDLSKESLPKRCFVPLDKSTENIQPNTKSGEFQLSNKAIVITYRRMLELIEKDLWDWLPCDELKYYPFFIKKYTDLINFNINDSLTVWKTNESREYDEGEIEKQFIELGSRISLIDRIWLAHKNIYEKRMRLELIELQKKMYYEKMNEII